MKLKLVVALLASTLWCGWAQAQETSSYNFVAKGTQGPGRSFANTTTTAFAISWNPTSTISSCAVQADSSADNVTWGSGDLIASQNCATAGSVAATSLATGKNFVRVNVTSLVGNGGLNVTLTGVSSASSSGAANAAPKMAFYLTSDCSTVVNAYCQNTPADTLQFNDCNWTAAATDVNCTASHFVSTDCVGGAGCTGSGTSKSAMGGLSCADDNQGAGTGGQIATTTAVTIASFISGTHITLSATPANAVAANGCFVYGHLDDAQAALVDTAMQAALTCPKLFLAASNYFFSSPHFFTNPPACAAIGPGLGSFGTTTLPAGFELEGRGVGPTTIYLNTNFPNGDACTHKATSGQNVGGCFAIPLMGKWSDFRFDGGAQHVAANLNNKALITMAVAKLQNFTCTNYGWLGTASIGLNTGLLARLDTVNIAGCGAIGWQVENGGSSEGLVVGYNVVSENSGTNALLIQGTTGPFDSLTCYWCDFAISGNAPNNSQVILNAGGILKMYGGLVLPGTSGSALNGINGYRCSNATGQAYFDGVYFNENAGGASNSNVAIYNFVSGCVTSVINSHVMGQSSGASFTDNSAGDTLYDLGGNTFSGPMSFLSTVIADGHSLLGTCTGVANASVTNSLYGTGPNVTATTCAGQTATLGTGLVMTQARTMQGMNCTSTATTVSVACTVMVNGAASAITCTITAATFCTDGTHTVAVNPRDLISMRIVTGAAETGANIGMFVRW